MKSVLSTAVLVSAALLASSLWAVTNNYSFDALNRLTHIDYPGAVEDVTLTYDQGTNCASGIGRLCRAEDESGITEFSYDGFGNLAAQRKTELGITYTTSYSYDPGDRVMSTTYPGGKVVTYTRDASRRIESITTTLNGQTQTVVANRKYRPDQLLISQTYGNGLNEVRSYDLKGLLTYQSVGAADTRVYEYDANSNVTRKQTLPEVAEYQYDALDRLIDERTAGDRNAFTYDANGNRQTELKPNGASKLYTYEPGTNRLIRVGGQDIVLDPAGFTLSDRNGKRTFGWNLAGRLSGVTVGGAVKATYTYNFLGQRTRKLKANGQQFVYHYDIYGRLITETRPNGRLVRAYVWADREPVAQIQVRAGQEELVYLHVDHLDTPRLATDAQQTVVWRFESEAFGTGKPETDPDADETKTNIRLRFAGQYHD